jgi:hypothetical protein
MDKVLGIFVLALFAIIIAIFIYQMTRYGGFKGAIFGSRITRLVGEVQAESSGPSSSVLKVHVL